MARSHVEDDPLSTDHAGPEGEATDAETEAYITPAVDATLVFAATVALALSLVVLL